MILGMPFFTFYDIDNIIDDYLIHSTKEEYAVESKAENKYSILADVQIGIGTWSWGDRLYWGYGRDYDFDDLRSSFDFCLESGINFFDTAETFGQGRSESFLGRFISSTTKQVRIATKFMPFPWRLSRNSLIRALRKSLKRLGISQIDLYQIHMPLPPITIEVWMDAMAEAVQSGYISAVGVSNYNRHQLQQAYDCMIQRGLQLTSIQVEYNLLNQKIEEEGMLKHCKELGVSIIAYSPLASGILTGKFGPEKPPKGFRRRRFSRQSLERIQPLLNSMQRIGADKGGKTIAQVALNWVICKGVIPIPGVKNLRQTEQNITVLGWRLSEEEIAILDEVSARVKNA
jgi:aryl-alcohol dehydrogenase-like predicted oxidoreductase